MFTNETKEIFLENLGSTWLYDSSYLFLIVPLGLIGAVLNCISFFVFLKKDLRCLHLYQYFQVYALTSVVLSLVLSGSFLHSPRFLFELSISKSARVYKCLIEASYVLPLCLFYSNALNILLNIERASSFTEKLKYFKNVSPYSACFCLFVVCVVINLPMYFLIDTAPDAYVYEAVSVREKALQFRGICTRNRSSLGLFGLIATWFSFVAKELIAFSFDIASNVVSIVCFKRLVAT